MARKMNTIRAAILDFRSKREAAKEMTEANSKAQPELIALMLEADPDNVGVIIDPDDRKTGAAYVQQNEPSAVWDEEAIADFLSKRPKLRAKVSTTVLDMRKWEAEVTAKNVPAKAAAKLQVTPQKPKPFIRFGKINENSL